METSSVVSRQPLSFEKSRCPCNFIQITLLVIGIIGIAVGVLGYLQVGVFSQLDSLSSAIFLGIGVIFSFSSLLAQDQEELTEKSEPTRPQKVPQQQTTTSSEKKPIVEKSETHQKKASVKKDSQFEILSAFYQRERAKLHPPGPLLSKDEQGDNYLHRLARANVCKGNIEKNVSDQEKAVHQNSGSVNERNAIGQTPLHVAVKHQNWHMVHALLQHVKEVSVPDWLGNTPLHYACQAIANDIQNGYYLVATEDSRYAIVRSLLAANANPYSLNAIGQTPLGMFPIVVEGEARKWEIDPLVQSLFKEAERYTSVAAMIAFTMGNVREDIDPNMLRSPEVDSTHALPISAKAFIQTIPGAVVVASHEPSINSSQTS